jgi:hypothetical protein
MALESPVIVAGKPLPREVGAKLMTLFGLLEIVSNLRYVIWDL